MGFQYLPGGRKVGIGVTGVRTPATADGQAGRCLQVFDGVAWLDPPELSQLVEGEVLELGQL